MSVLSDDIMNTEQLSIRDCFEIDMGGWIRHMDRNIVIAMCNYVYDELEKLYGGADFINEDFFPTIYNDIPGLMYEYMYKTGRITWAERDKLLEDTYRESPYWGVPEVPSMSTPIVCIRDFGGDVEAIHTYVSNRVWEKRWEGTSPIVYDQFIRFMTKHWNSRLQFCHNPNPWKTLTHMISTTNNGSNEYTL